MRRAPFRPIRIYVSDGSFYDVRHPEIAAVNHTEVVIGLQVGDDDLPERFAYCDPLHITRIEPIDGEPPSRKRPRRK